MPAVEELLAKLAVALERNRIPYMIIDGQAVLVDGEPRFIGDIDITIGVDTDMQESVRRIAHELSLEPIQGMTDKLVKRNALLTVGEKETGIAIGFMFSFLPHERQAITRAVAVPLGEAQVKFATAYNLQTFRRKAGSHRGC